MLVLEADAHSSATKMVGAMVRKSSSGVKKKQKQRRNPVAGIPAIILVQHTYRDGYWKRLYPDRPAQTIIRHPIGMLFPDSRGFDDNPSLHAVMNGDWSGVSRRIRT